MSYPVQLAIDLLDQMTTEKTVDRGDLIRGALALALFRAPSGAAPDVDTLGVLADLERLALGATELDGDSFRRMVRVVAALRPAVGVH